jgi:hypothetical protein
MHKIVMQCEGALLLADKILQHLAIQHSSEVQGINLLLPFDTSTDLKCLLVPIIKELKFLLTSATHRPIELEFLFTQKFKA